MIESRIQEDRKQFLIFLGAVEGEDGRLYPPEDGRYGLSLTTIQRKTGLDKRKIAENVSRMKESNKSKPEGDQRNYGSRHFTQKFNTKERLRREVYLSPDLAEDALARMTILGLLINNKNFVRPKYIRSRYAGITYITMSRILKEAQERLMGGEGHKIPLEEQIYLESNTPPRVLVAINLSKADTIIEGYLRDKSEG